MNLKSQKLHVAAFIVVLTSCASQPPLTSFQLGMASQSQGDCSNAIKHYSETIEKNEYNKTEALANRGICKYQLKDYEGAIQDSEAAISYSPKAPGPYITLSGAKFRLKDFDGALKPLHQVINMYPKNFKARYNMAFIKHSQKDHEGALNAYNKALELEPKSDQEKKSYLELLANKGSLIMFMGDREGGCKYMRNAMAQGVESVQSIVKDNCQ